MKRDGSENKKLWLVLAGLGGVIVILAVTIIIVAVINKGSSEENYAETEEEVSQAFDDMVDYISNLKDKQIAEAKAEADATDDVNKKAEAFYKRINNMLEQEQADVAGALMTAGEDYFKNLGITAGVLAVYTGIDYDKMTSDPYVYHYYQKIMDLANELGDEQVQAEWQDRYNAAKTRYDEYNEAAGEDEELEDEEGEYEE